MKRTVYLGLSFLLVKCVLMFWVESQTFCPTAYSGVGDRRTSAWRFSGGGWLVVDVSGLLSRHSHRTKCLLTGHLRVPLSRGIEEVGGCVHTGRV